MGTSKHRWLFSLPAIGLLSLYCLCQALSVHATPGVQSTKFDCDPGNSPDSTEPINAFPEGFRSLDINLVSDPTKDSFCNWTLDIQNFDSTFLLNRLTLAKDEYLSISGVDNGTETQIFKSNDLMNAGFLDVKSYKKISISLVLKKDNPDKVQRSFSAKYTWKSPTILTASDSTMTLVLNQVNKTINSNFTLSPPIEYGDKNVFLLSFVKLPKSYKIDVNDVSYDDKNKPLPTHLLASENSIKLNVNNYNPTTDEKIVIRFWTVTKVCSGNLVLNDGTARDIPYVKPEDAKALKLDQAICVQLLQGVKGSQIVVDIPTNTTALLFPEDSLTFYDTTGTIELGLNMPALMYFRNVDTFLTKDQYLIVYKTPYFGENPTKDFKPPTLKSTNGGCFMIEEGKDIEKTFDGKAKLDEVHTLYSTAFLDPQNPVEREIQLEFDSVEVTAGDWSIEVHDNELKSSKPLITFGKFDRLPKIVPSKTPVMRVVYKGQVPALKLKYKSVVKSNSCVWLGTGNGVFDVKGNQSNGNCSWIIPTGSGNFTILSPIYVKVPVDKSLMLTWFREKGSSVQEFKGPLDKTFMPDLFLSSHSLYEMSINPSGSKDSDLHVMFQQRSNYMNSTVQIDSSASNIRSVNYPGAYPFGYNQINYVQGEGKVFMVIQDMNLMSKHNFSVLAPDSKNKEQEFISNNLNEVYDKVISYPVALFFNTNAVDFGELVRLDETKPRGFDIDFIHVSVGENIDLAKNKSFEFHSGNASFVNKIAVWAVKIDDKSKNLSDTILRINVTFGEDPKKNLVDLKIYDSISIRKNFAHEALPTDLNQTDGKGLERRFVTSTKVAFIVYNFTEAVTSKLNFDIKFNVQEEKCGHQSNLTKLVKCRTVDRCITDPMICNGVNDCGDWSDEIDCGGIIPPPNPPAPNGGGGVSVVVAIFLLMPLGAIVGIFGYVYLPHALLRLRNGRYSEFRDLSSVS